MKRTLKEGPAWEKSTSTPSLLEHSTKDVCEDAQFCIHQTKRSCYCALSQCDTQNSIVQPIQLAATSSSRLTELSAIVRSCSHQELVFLRQVIEPLLKRDFIRQLPLEVSLRILSYLRTRDLLNCAKVSRHWNTVTSDQLLWFKRCQQDNLLGNLSLFPDLQNDYATKHTSPSSSVASRLAVSVSTCSSESCGFSDSRTVTPTTPQINWKTVYQRSLQTQCNWRKGCSWPPIVLPAHHNHVITCLEVCNDWIITGSDDSSICVWSATHGELVINLFGHIGGVWSLAVLSSSSLTAGSAPLLVSGSCDRTARVWLLDGTRWPCVATLFGHQSTVRCVAAQRPHVGHGQEKLACSPLHDTYSKDSQYSQIGTESDQSTDFTDDSSLDYPPDSHLVVTGSRDTTLRLWDALSGRCIHTFRGHRGAIRCVQFTGANVVSGSYDCTVRLWCIRTGNCVRVLNGHKNRVYTLLYDGCHIISASLDTTIRVWDARTGALKQLFCGHRSLTSEMAYGYNQGILVSSNADETIRVWNLETGECIHTLSGRHKHQSAVTCVQLTRHFIISSSDDGTVKLWDRFTGSYIRDLLRLSGAGRGGVVWRILSSETRLVCAVGSRNGSETTKLVILHFAEPDATATYSHVCRTQPQSSLPPHPGDSVYCHLHQTANPVNSISTN